VFIHQNGGDDSSCSRKSRPDHIHNRALASSTDSPASVSPVRLSLVPLFSRAFSSDLMSRGSTFPVHKSNKTFISNELSGIATSDPAFETVQLHDSVQEGLVESRRHRPSSSRSMRSMQVGHSTFDCGVCRCSRVREGVKTMLKKTSRAIERQPKLRCPHCRERIYGEITPKELRQYGHSILPKLGDLTQCEGCGTMLEYGCDPAFMVLKPAPQWRVDLINEVDSIPGVPSLPEMIEGVRKRRPVRLLAHFAPRMGTTPREN
jgi:hypothetical protein